ncbi:MAG: sugar phosphate isomerase/epimerase [Bacteroidaceae bacterium]|nr:sugar phosphate isomerase/epimerase [Bacteroidaceae bacterium]
MKRRLSVIIAVALSVSLSTVFTACGSSRGGSNSDLFAGHEYGIQMYTLRAMIGNAQLYEANHARVIDSLRAYGITKAELYGYDNGLMFGTPAAKVASDLKNSGITPVSSHVQNPLTPQEIETGDFSGKLDWWNECIALHKSIGVNTIVYGWYAFPNSMLELQRIAEYLDWAGELCRRQGIDFGYHNHDHELRRIDRTVVLDYLIRNTKPENVFIEMDVYWTVYGHGSPVEYFERYPGRFRILHIKDQYEIGQSGMVGFDAIFRNIEKSGARHLIVEQETTRKADMLESLRISMDYLHGN